MQSDPNANVNKDTTIVNTNSNAQNGQDKCPKCGATEIEYNAQSGKLRCCFCRYEFTPEKAEGLQEDLHNLSGQVLTSGLSDINQDFNDVVTLKCSSCGAEVVIDTASAAQARCHWCRNTLSINEQIPNGSVPDVVLPFSIPKEDARKAIAEFVGKRKFFAHPQFQKEFTTENIMGVYFPYIIIDTNCHANLVGKGEHLVRRYTVGSGDNQTTYYDADLYDVEREFDLLIEGLTIESSSDKLNNSSQNKTNNVINAIMPFDIENCVKYNANYLKGYTSEKRDVNVDNVRPLVETQSKDIVRFAANPTLTSYDRGVAWSSENVEVKGQQWKAAYLPVWLYSYQQVSGEKKILHYVAVNARTKETMGSVPIHMPKLLITSGLVELLGIMAMLFVDWDYSFLFLLLGVIFYFVMYRRYRNAGARHTYELETKTTMENLRKVDTFIQAKKGLTNSRMMGANNTSVNGSSVHQNFLDNFLGNGPNVSVNMKDNQEPKK